MEYDEISVKHFGAKGDGIANDTKALQNAFKYCFSNNKNLVIDSGEYLITEPLIKASKEGSGQMKIICKGIVDFKLKDEAEYSKEHLIYLSYTNYGNITISGGTLNIDLKQKLPYGIRIDALGMKEGKEYRGIGGVLKISSKVSISNAFANKSSYGKAAGIIVNGVFKEVYIENMTIKNIARDLSFPYITNKQEIDETKGIAISNLKGHLEIINPKVENISTPNDRDADGIAIFGYKPNYSSLDENYKTQGTGIIKDAVIIDAQGRGIKIQCSDVKIINPYFIREKVVSITHGNDIDFQWGNGYVENSTHEYKKYKGVSPIKSSDSYNCIVFQNKLKDIDMLSKVKGLHLLTDVPIANIFALITGKNSKSWSVEVADVNIDEITSKFIKRAVLKFSMNRKYGIPSMLPKSKATILLDNIMTKSQIVAYTGFDGTPYTQILQITKNSKNILKSKTDKAIFQNLSGQCINIE